TTEEKKKTVAAPAGRSAVLNCGGLMYLTKILNWRGILSLAIAPWVLLTIGFAVQQPPAPLTASAQLDFEFFKTQVQPIFLAKRPGRARCIACHITSTPMRLQPLAPGNT